MVKIRESRNRASDKEAASFVDEVDRLEQEREAKLATLDAEFKAKKRDINSKINGDQKAILADAKKVGVAKGIIRALADSNKAIRKATEKLEEAKERAEDRIEALEPEDRDFAVDIRKALGDDFAGLPLGAAAVVREEKPASKKTAAQAAADAWDAASPKLN